MTPENRVFETMSPDEFRAYLRQLQQALYSWPNDYFAWEKPDGSLFMVGISSTQYGHILKHELEAERYTEAELVQLGKDLGLPGPAPYERDYVSYLYGISPTTSYMRVVNGEHVEIDPVEELTNEVRGYKYLGSWRDPVQFVPHPVFGQVIAHGRWDLAKEHIIGKEKLPPLSERITEAALRAAIDSPRAREKTLGPER